MDVVELSAADQRLLAARYTEHGNSHRRMRGALVEAAAHAVVERLDALRALERRFQVDLGSVCWRFGRRRAANVHPIERWVIDYVTDVRRGEDAEALWVLLDRVREIRDLMEGRLVGEPEP